MIELPEAYHIAGQMNGVLPGKRVRAVTAGHTPHKMAWFYGEPAKYGSLINGKQLGEARAFGSMVEISAAPVAILLNEGVGIRFHAPGQPHPPKHQLLIEFDDGSALSAAVQMYGGMGVFLEGGLDNRYYKAAKERPSPFSSGFDSEYFSTMVSSADVQKLSLKGLLATDQRIPGLGNGSLQDILFNARMHPRKKVDTLSDKDRTVLFNAVRVTLTAMAAGGGRDTEFDLYGKPGAYKTILSKNTAGKPCPVCGTTIKKEAYMGGSVYSCDKCQAI
jgi:formamidopyrimidine-DNA glycosylase